MSLSSAWNLVPHNLS